jgi:hypothetical protein
MPLFPPTETSGKQALFSGAADVHIAQQFFRENG